MDAARISKSVRRDSRLLTSLLTFSGSNMRKKMLKP